jgi:hypothetical protein
VGILYFMHREDVRQRTDARAASALVFLCSLGVAPDDPCVYTRERFLGLRCALARNDSDMLLKVADRCLATAWKNSDTHSYYDRCTDSWNGAPFHAWMRAALWWAVVDDDIRALAGAPIDHLRGAFRSVDQFAPSAAARVLINARLAAGH